MDPEAMERGLVLIAASWAEEKNQRETATPRGVQRTPEQEAFPPIGRGRPLRWNRGLEVPGLALGERGVQPQTNTPQHSDEVRPKNQATTLAQTPPREIPEEQQGEPKAGPSGIRPRRPETQQTSQAGTRAVEGVREANPAHQHVECHKCHQLGHLLLHCPNPAVDYCRTCKNKKVQRGKIWICEYWTKDWHLRWVERDRKKKQARAEYWARQRGDDNWDARDGQ